MASKVEAEVLEATGLEQKRGESRTDFLDRVAEYVDDNKKFTDKDYNSLGDAAQKWCNAACTAIGKKESVPEFPADEEPKGSGKKDDDTKASGVSGSSDEEEEVAGKTTKASSGKAAKAKDNKVAKTGDLKKAAGGDAKKADTKKADAKADKKNGNGGDEKKAAAKKVKESKPPKERKAGGKSADLKKLILDKPERTNAELMELMKGKGHEITLSTLSTIRAGFLHSLQVIIDAGRLKDKGAK